MALSPSNTTIVDVTDKAHQAMKRLLDGTDHLGIRLGVVGGGCAGLQYEMNPCDTHNEGDFIQQVQDITLYIHPVAAAYLKGTIVDYSDAMVDGGFKFTNPNAASTCGCGTSFGL